MLLNAPLVFDILISPAATALANSAIAPLLYQANPAIFTPKK